MTVKWGGCLPMMARASYGPANEEPVA